MEMREWLYNWLLTDPDLEAEIHTQLFEGESLDTSLSARPLVVYTIGNATDEQLSEETRPYRQFFQIYVHDRPADYTRIDRIVRIIKRRLKQASSKEAGVIQVFHLETSRDLDDQSMETVMRYIRFQAVMEE